MFTVDIFTCFLLCHLTKLNVLVGEHFHHHSEGAALKLAAMELNNILSKVSTYWAAK